MGWSWRLALGAILLTASGVMAAEPAPNLRVLTLNLYHGGPSSGLIGDGGQLEARLTMVIAELRALRPDVVALQEASDGWGRGNVAARLAAALGLHHVHAPATSRLSPLALLNRLLVFAMNFNEGPAVLSRFPIASSTVHDLPRCERALHPRVMLEAEIATPWGPLRVYSTHTERDACQHERIAELVAARRGPLPSILMGDFNAHGCRGLDRRARQRGRVHRRLSDGQCRCAGADGVAAHRSRRAHGVPPRGLRLRAAGNRESRPRGGQPRRRQHAGPR